MLKLLLKLLLGRKIFITYIVTSNQHVIYKGTYGVKFLLCNVKLHFTFDTFSAGFNWEIQ